MASFFADEDFPEPAVWHLRKLGHDVLTCGDVGMSNRRIPDDIVLEFSTRLERAVLTMNRDDFAALHDRGVIHACIVACDHDRDFEALARRIDRAVAAEALMSGRLIHLMKQ